jgi:hypothetical protein
MQQPPAKSTLDHLALELRSAVLASNHELAASRSVDYTAALSSHWANLSGSQRANSPLPKQSLELLNWAREMTIVQQALAAQHLAIVEKANRYQTARAVYLRTANFDPQR